MATPTIRVLHPCVQGSKLNHSSKFEGDHALSFPKMELELELEQQDHCYDPLRNEQTATFLTYETVVSGYGNCVIGILGLIGNFFCCVVLFRRDMRKYCFNQLLITLVITDSIHIIFGILEGVRLSFESYYPRALLDIFPYFHYPLYRISLAASIYLMIGLAFERYFAICKPYFHRCKNIYSTWSLCFIIPAILSGILVNVPRFFETRTETSFVYDANCTIVTTVTELMPTALRLNKIYIVAYVNWTWTLFTVLIPFAILVYLSVKIFFGLKGVRANLKRHKDMSKRSSKYQLKLQPPESSNERPGCPMPSNNAGNRRSDGEVHLLVSVSVAGKTPEVTENDALPVVPDPEHPLQLGKPPAVLLPQRVRNANGGTRKKCHAAVLTRETNMTIVLVSSLAMFLLCHLPRMFITSYEAAVSSFFVDCFKRGQIGVPLWFLYVTPLVKFLQVLNASANFPIYLIMSKPFKASFQDLTGYNKTGS